MTRALVCVLCVVWMWMYDDSNVCFMHACLLGGRCLGRRCKVLLTHPGYTLRRLCLPESEKKKKKKKKKKKTVHCFQHFNYHSVLPIYLILFIYWCGIFVILNMSLLYIYISTMSMFFCFFKTIPLYNIYPVLYDYYYYFGGCRASGYV